MAPNDMQPNDPQRNDIQPGRMETSKMDTSKMDTRKMETNPPASPLTPSAPQDRQVNPAQNTVAAPARPKGANASPVIIGLVALLFAGLVIAQETMRLQVDWSRLAPGTIVGIGVVMVVIGAIGLARRHDHV